ncbi:sulfate ABC transporter permease subunit CysT [Brevibacillus marinus]|uniref:sulfate ABC transporter permease subunit CysT n=1 Tax=Brevibacillus marinus TaxID=2496837 RepID=UPI003B96F8C1
MVGILKPREAVLPGFRLTLGFTLFYLSCVVLIPLSVLFLQSAALSWQEYWQVIADPRVLAAFRLSFSAALLAGALNIVFGLLVAWVFTRYSFPGKRLLDGLIDLPFALPTAVAGISLTAVYSANGWIGRYAEALGIKIAFAPLGVVVALTFVGLPFVVRTVQPVLLNLEQQVEEAAVTLGATRWQTFWRVIFPQLLPALLTGFALAFARAVGEYGSVVFISGNMPMSTEIVPLLIMTKLEQYDYVGATAIALAMLLVSFAMLLCINLLQWQSSRRSLSG